MDEKRKNEMTAEADGVIEGRNAVIEALRAGDATAVETDSSHRIDSKPQKRLVRLRRDFAVAKEQIGRMFPIVSLHHGAVE